MVADASRKLPSGRCPRGARGGFSLLDILVSMAVISLLMSIMLPTLSQMQETARRVNCASNIRNHGMGITFYATDRQDALPGSVFLRGEFADPAKMTTLRLSPGHDKNGRRQGQRGNPDRTRMLVAGDWDGLGVLVGLDYLNAPKIFYCPSHRGEHPYERYAGEFQIEPRQAPAPRVIGNYHYRGQGPNGARHLTAIRPSSAALIADGLESKTDFNHTNGTNLLRADYGVTWFRDLNGALLAALSQIEAGTTGFGEADPWTIIDAGGDGQFEY